MKSRKRRITKRSHKTASGHPQRGSRFKSIPCDGCGDIVDKVDIDSIGVTCGLCVQKMVPYDAPVKRAGPRRPQGWHFRKEFVDTDGNVFHRGVEQTELKGTLDPTPFSTEKKKRRSRLKDEDELIERELRKLTVKKQKATGKKYYKTTGRKQGWHRKKVFVDPDGTVFFRGVEQTELKGSLPTTE